MKDVKIRERFIELRAQGVSLERISKELKTSKQTLVRWNSSFSGQIKDYKLIEWEALQEKYFILKKNRIELLGERLLSIKNELDRRDLKDIRADRLLELLLKLTDALKREEVETESRLDRPESLRGELLMRFTKQAILERLEEEKRIESLSIPPMDELDERLKAVRRRPLEGEQE